jgi:hypothetical protein
LALSEPRHITGLFDNHVELLARKGIDPALMAGRYLSYTKGDVEQVCLLAPWVRESPHVRGYVQQSGGLVVVRKGLQPKGEYVGELHMVVPSAEGEPAPYLRPDRPVYTGEGWAKYLNPPGAKRIDVHPDVRDLAKQGRAPIFFCLEGSLNADAALSHGLLAISVPGVTLWQALDLKDGRVCDWLRRAPAVFVVSDADWETNPMVTWQVTQAVRYLCATGIRACHVAPPADDRDGGKTGLNDHLVRGWQPEELLLIPTLLGEPSSRLPERERRVMEALLRGPLVQRVQPAWLAQEVAMSKRTVCRALASLEGFGQIEVKAGRTHWDRVAGRWTTDPKTVRLLDLETPKSLKDRGVVRSMLLLPKKGQRVSRLHSELVTNLVARSEIETARVGVSKCKTCGRPLGPAKTRRPKLYCNSTCRVRAHRARRL